MGCDGTNGGQTAGNLKERQEIAILEQTERIDGVAQSNARLAEARMSGQVARLDYHGLLAARWRTIALCAVLSMVVTYLVAGFVLTPYYRAFAVLRPVAPQSSVGKLAGMGAALGGLGMGGGLSALLPGGGQQADQAEEYMAILQSYAFTMSLVDEGRPVALEIAERARPWLGFGRATDDWQRYKLMQARFSCEYDRLAGNLNLYFLDADPVIARRTLSIYVSQLREKLRAQDVRDANEAIDSLTREAQQTSDAVMRTELYMLLANQVEQKTTAQVKADFAFTTIEPPVVPDKPFKPRALLDALVAALVGGLLAAGVITGAALRGEMP